MIQKHEAAVVVFAALALAGCESLPPGSDDGRSPSFVAAAEPVLDIPKVALVLSGGSARGYAHVGVIKVLEANGLRPDIVVGCSAGSIVAALYASGMTSEELQRAIASLDTSSFNDWALPGIAFLDSPLGLFKGERLHHVVDSQVKHHMIDAFPIRFGAVATDLASGAVIVFNSGDVGKRGGLQHLPPKIK